MGRPEAGGILLFLRGRFPREGALGVTGALQGAADAQIGWGTESIAAWEQREAELEATSMGEATGSHSARRFCKPEKGPFGVKRLCKAC